MEDTDISELDQSSIDDVKISSGNSPDDSSSDPIVVAEKSNSIDNDNSDLEVNCDDGHDDEDDMASNDENVSNYSDELNDDDLESFKFDKELSDIESDVNCDQIKKSYPVDPDESDVDEDSKADSDNVFLLDYEYFEDELDDFIEAPETCFEPKKAKVKKLISKKESSEIKNVRKYAFRDDGTLKLYQKRLKAYRLHCAEANLTYDPDDYELYSVADDFRLPKEIWDKLFFHQQECVRWLWNNHINLSGGIIGDEMGLGKTIELIAFLIGLRYSKFAQIGQTYSNLGPVLLVCPSTLMLNWVREFHTWWPHFRVALLHNSGTYKSKNKKPLIRELVATNGILITSYNGINIYRKELIECDWHYVILDEGHKIRNPDASVTRRVKMLGTVHRLILTGTPIQNNLKELWSLFDFIYPGKLGSLEAFMRNIARPIREGGLANAKEIHIRVAYKCTIMLRDLIKPYLIRRTKEEINDKLALPSKNEQVLFCKLTDEQRDIYSEYLKTDIIREAMSGKLNFFKVLMNLRKICNHPYLFTRKFRHEPFKMNSSFIKKSGKLIVLKSVLKLWFSQGHRVLIFTQTIQMLDIIEKFVSDRGYQYFRLDGNSYMNSRQVKIDNFNRDESIFLFLLTTRVGGVGLNLIGANRVIIFDPDWNPSTDIQARERCWRIGQTKNVIIYRLMTVGTVEEKIYHRQIFKQYLTKRVLENPCHRKFFKFNSLHELFTLQDNNETSEMFSESRVMSEDNKNTGIKRKFVNQTTTKSMLIDSGRKLPKIAKISKSSDLSVDDGLSQIEVKLSDEKIKELQLKAKLLSQRFNEIYFSKKSTDKESDSSDIKNDNSDSSKETANKQTLDTSSETIDSSKLTEKNAKAKKPSGIKFDGKRIRNLLKMETFNDKPKKVKKKKDEDYILKSLLGNTLQSVLQHDQIENPVSDYNIVDRQADEIANKALKHLYEDSNQNSSQTKNLFGKCSNLHTNDPSNSYSNISSQTLIQMMTNNNQLGHYPFSSTVPSTSSFSFHSKPLSTPNRLNESVNILRSIQHFLLTKHNKGATSDDITKQFEYIRPEQTSIFRSSLKKLCNYCRDSKLWILKEEFSR